LLDAVEFLPHSAGMSSDEREIFHYLQTWGVEFVSAKEVSRRAGSKKRYHEDPDWAKPLLMALAERGVLESDSMGRYRVKPERKKGHKQRWVSPEIEKLLKENGVEVDGETKDTIAQENSDSP
jgi:hypothetical protein